MNKSDNTVFWSAFILSVGLYVFFLKLRGFGWDGDSFCSAAQFVKILNPMIYGLNDGGTHPKLLSIIVFGLVYHLFHDFVFLTFIAIILNSLMTAFICKWAETAGGLWWIAFVGISINIHWDLIVINCDNPAFSVPFLIFGLYSYFQKNRKTLGSILLMVSNFFRPGAEVIIICIICLELFKKDRHYKNYALLSGTLLLSLAHTFFGFHLAYTKEQFLALCVYYFPKAQFQSGVYMHSVFFLLPYLKSVFNQIVHLPDVIFLFIAGSCFVQLIKQRKRIVYISLALLATLILPVGTFFYGVINNTSPEKHMEFTIVIPAVAAVHPLWKKIDLFRFRSLAGHIFAFCIFMGLCLFIGISGSNYHGMYEVTTDGNGFIPWKRHPKVACIIDKTLPKDYFYRALISRNDRIFFILDQGMRARKIDVIEDLNYGMNGNLNYDLILIPDNVALNQAYCKADGYRSFRMDKNYTLFVNKSKLISDYRAVDDNN